MKRKHFILTVIAVCVVALIAEAVLLIKTFSKKDKKNPVENVISPTGEPDLPVLREVRKVKKVSYKEDWNNSSRLVFEEFTYDEAGREIRRVKYHDEEPYEEEITIYDENGITRETWVPDRNGTLNRFAFTDNVGETTVVSRYESDLERLVQIVTDEDGRVIRLDYVVSRSNYTLRHIVEWEYRDDIIVNRTETEKKDERETKRIRKEYAYNESRKVCGFDEYRAEEGGKEELYATTEITYDGNRKAEETIREVSGNSTVREYRDSVIESETRFYSDGKKTEYRYLILDDFKELVRTDFGSPYRKLCFFSTQAYDGTELTRGTKIQHDEQQRITFGMDSAMVVGNYYNQYRYSYGEDGKLNTFLIETLTGPGNIVGTRELRYHYDEYGNVDSISVSDEGKTIGEAVIEWVSIMSAEE